MIPSASERNINMETMPYLWTENSSTDEIKHRLLCTKFELITARMEANTEIKKYKETIKHLFKMLKTACQERDEARHQLQQLLRNLQLSTPTRDHLHPSKESTQKPYTSCSKAFSYCSYDSSLANLQPNEKLSSMGISQTKISESSNLSLTLPKQQPTHQNRTGRSKADIGFSRVDRASVMIDKLVWGKPLPQKGRLLRSVTEAGPLLQTLLVAPLPRWQNPPSLSSSFCLPPNGTHGSDSSSTVDDKSSVNQNGLIPTSLSLAFPGNSRGPSLPSFASGSGLSVKNEPVACKGVDSDMTHKHNHILTAKRRKLL